LILFQIDHWLRVFLIEANAPAGDPQEEEKTTATYDIKLGVTRTK